MLSSGSTFDGEHTVDRVDLDAVQIVPLDTALGSLVEDKTERTGDGSLKTVVEFSDKCRVCIDLVELTLTSVPHWTQPLMPSMTHLDRSRIGILYLRP